MGRANFDEQVARAYYEGHSKASTGLALTYYNKLWIIKGVLARGETSNWFGPPGVGKSVLITDLAFHIAAGWDWRGYRSKERCGVVYIALERGALVKRRLSAYMRNHNKTDLPIAVASNVVDLRNRNCVKLIVDTIHEAEARFGCKVGLVVIDTISKGIAAGGGDEDKAKDQNIVLANLRRVEELTDIHIACVGHTGKDEGRGHRGSNANVGDMDLMVQITGDGAVKTATVIKINDGHEGPLTHYKINSALLGTDDDGDAITTAIISDEAAEAEAETKSKRGLNGAERRALELLTRCINDQGWSPPASTEFPPNVRVVLAKEWHVTCERGGLSAAADKKDRDKAFRRAREGLHTKMRIAFLDDWVWLVRDDG
jgi:AAA domain